MHYDVLIKDMSFAFHEYTFLSNYMKNKNRFHLLIFGPIDQLNTSFIDLKQSFQV